MRSSIWVVFALCTAALSAPTQTYSTLASQPLEEMEALSAYFQALAFKVEAVKGKVAPACNAANAVLPAGTSILQQHDSTWTTS
jgi:hypothetical protein